MIKDKILELGIAHLSDAEILSTLKAIQPEIGSITINQAVNYDARCKIELAMNDIITSPDASDDLKYEADIFVSLIKDGTLPTINIGDATTQYALTEFINFKGPEQNFTQEMRDKLENEARGDSPFKHLTIEQVQKAKLSINPSTVEVSYPDNKQHTSINGNAHKISIEIVEPLPFDTVFNITASSKLAGDADYGKDTNNRGFIVVKAGETGVRSYGKTNQTGLSKDCVKYFVDCEVERNFTALVDDSAAR